MPSPPPSPQQQRGHRAWATTSTLNSDGVRVITSQHHYTIPSSTMTTLGNEVARLISPTPQHDDESDGSPPLTTYYTSHLCVYIQEHPNKFCTFESLALFITYVGIYKPKS
jgi:hypothetical protein